VEAVGTQDYISAGGRRGGRPHGTQGRGSRGGGADGARPLAHTPTVQAIVSAWKGEGEEQIETLHQCGKVIEVHESLGMFIKAHESL